MTYVVVGGALNSTHSLSKPLGSVEPRLKTTDVWTTINKWIWWWGWFLTEHEWVIAMLVHDTWTHLTVTWECFFPYVKILLYSTHVCDIFQEEAGVNHIAAKVIDSVSARPGPHAAVCILVCVVCIHYCRIFLVVFWTTMLKRFSEFKSGFVVE